MSENKKILCARKRRKNRSKYKIISKNKSQRFRVSFYESNKNLYVQLLNDFKGETIVSVSSYENKFSQYSNINKDNIKKLAVVFAERCNEANIKECVFDKGHRKFTGKIKAFVDTIRENGIIV